ncbi:flagellar biosynthesis protein FlhF [Halioxenophilus sp. WMMB6]|uniref:flagellar biosynthesis protein FlhF n=1 Tax=Halioxenophilus sp. WMMB6 TaxID=3073815 RepID=UPI00295EEB94|nr:flagellar biosynthesis protein FlhF [Halioxenophilus sp. WMMB6]
MQIKRYKAADMRRALELVRTDLGDDAVILSSSKNGKGVEILATSDDCQQWLKPENKPEPLPEDKVTSAFAKYELAAEQESLAMESDPTVEGGDDALVSISGQKAISGQKNSAEQKKDPRADVSYLAQQLEKLNISFPGRAAPRAEKPMRSVPTTATQAAASQAVAESIELVSKPNTPMAETSASEPDNRFARTHSMAQEAHQQRQIDLLQTELSDMRELLELQLQQSQFANLKGPQLAADRRLELMGFGNQFRTLFHRQCDLSLEKQQENAWRTTISYLSSQIKTLNCDLIKSGGQLAFVGPTGAGKTTTIAKLATRYVLAEGRESVALVTLDNERLGSQGQLRSLANILQIPLRTVVRAEDLPQTLASLDYCRLVLIDTPGVNAEGMQQDPFLQQLFALPSVSKLLVLACNAQSRFQRNLLDSVAEQAVRALVLTKLDETDCLGETLDAVVASQLPVAYTTDGQNIPDDIAVAKAHHLISRSVAALQQSRKPGRVGAGISARRQSA